MINQPASQPSIHPFHQSVTHLIWTTLLILHNKSHLVSFASLLPPARPWMRIVYGKVSEWEITGGGGGGGHWNVSIMTVIWLKSIIIRDLITVWLNGTECVSGLPGYLMVVLQWREPCLIRRQSIKNQGRRKYSFTVTPIKLNPLSVLPPLPLIRTYFLIHFLILTYSIK